MYVFAVEAAYAEVFIRKCKSSDFQIIEGYNASKPLNDKASEAVKSRIRSSICKRMASAVSKNAMPRIKSLFENLATECGYLQEFRQFLAGSASTTNNTTTLSATQKPPSENVPSPSVPQSQAATVPATQLNSTEMTCSQESTATIPTQSSSSQDMDDDEMVEDTANHNQSLNE